MHTIYCIICLVNNKKYVGYTSKSINERLRGHFYDSKRCKYPLSRAICKYGKENFVIEILEKFDDKRIALEAEKAWIKKLNTQNSEIGYNIADGGDLGGWHCLSHNEKSEKTKQSQENMGKEKRSEIALKRWQNKSADQLEKDRIRLQKQSVNNWQNMSQEKRDERARKLSEKNKEHMKSLSKETKQKNASKGGNSMWAKMNLEQRTLFIEKRNEKIRLAYAKKKLNT